MTTGFEITDKELREVFELLTKEQLIEALIRKHKKLRGIEKKCVTLDVSLVCKNCGKTKNEHSKASEMCPNMFNHFEKACV